MNDVEFVAATMQMSLAARALSDTDLKGVIHKCDRVESLGPIVDGRKWQEHGDSYRHIARAAEAARTFVDEMQAAMDLEAAVEEALDG